MVLFLDLPSTNQVYADKALFILSRMNFHHHHACVMIMNRIDSLTDGKLESTNTSLLSIPIVLKLLRVI